MVDVFNRQKVAKLEQQIRKYKDKCLQLMDENKSLKEELENTKAFNKNLILLIEGYLDTRKQELKQEIIRQYNIPNIVDPSIVQGIPHWWRKNIGM